MSGVPVVIYHGGCRDGWAAAAIAHRYFKGHAVFHAGYYGQLPPLEIVYGSAVYILDFSYPLAELRQLALAASKLVILDHHKTAQADLEWLQHPTPEQFEVWMTEMEVIFDMERSGAGIAWDYFFERHTPRYQPRPWWVDYVEDRDLWRWALRDSKLINAYLGALPFEFHGWAEGVGVSPEHAVTMGRAIELKVHQYVAEVAKNVRFGNLYGAPGVDFAPSPVFDEAVPIVNAPQCDVSELLDFLMDAEDQTIAVAWWQRADGLYQYGLRSRGDLDVSAVARRFGGGGHKNAAGFQVAYPVHR